MVPPVGRGKPRGSLMVPPVGRTGGWGREYDGGKRQGEPGAAARVAGGYSTSCLLLAACLHVWLARNWGLRFDNTTELVLQILDIEIERFRESADRVTLVFCLEIKVSGD